MVIPGCERICDIKEPAYTFYKGKLWTRNHFASLSSLVCGDPKYDAGNYNWLCADCARRLHWIW